jgi:hypothetical protein
MCTATPIGSSLPDLFTPPSLLPMVAFASLRFVYSMNQNVILRELYIISNRREKRLKGH